VDYVTFGNHEFYICEQPLPKDMGYNGYDASFTKSDITDKKLRY
jgi:hypothetical protein